MNTGTKTRRMNIFSFIRTQKWRYRLRRWYLVARQCFLVVLMVAATVVLHGIFAESAAAQGTLVVPLGITPGQGGPAHQTHQFPHKENYFMLPVTASGTVQSGYGQRTVVNKPVAINPKRKTVIPLSGLTTQASPTPVVPEGFNARYVQHASAPQNPPPQPTYQAQKTAYTQPVVIRRHAAPPAAMARVQPPARQEAGNAAPALEIKPAAPAAHSVLVQNSPPEPSRTPDIPAETPTEAVPEEPAKHEYDHVPAEMDASLPALPTPAESRTEPETPTRHETGYHNIYETPAEADSPADIPADAPAEPDFLRLPERDAVPAPPQLPVPVHTRFYGDDVTEVTEPEPEPKRTNIPPSVSPARDLPPSGQAPAVLPAGPRPRRPGNVVDLYREQTSTAPQPAVRPQGQEPRKTGAPADTRSGIPVNMSREKRGDADAYPTTLPPGRTNGYPYEDHSWSGPSV